MTLKVQLLHVSTSGPSDRETDFLFLVIPGPRLPREQLTLAQKALGWEGQEGVMVAGWSAAMGTLSPRPS